MVDEPEDPQAAGLRFEATVRPQDIGVALSAMAEHVAQLDLDRIPDPEGGVRLLVNAEECAQLLEQGYEVRLVRAVPVRPLDPDLIAGEEEVSSWVEERLGRADGGRTT